MASRAVTEDRVRWCYGQLLNARPTSRLVAEAADRWGLSRRQARNIVGRAYKELSADLEGAPIEKKEMLSKMIAATEAAIEQGIRDGHGHVVLGGVNTLSRLLGIGAEHRPVNPYASKISGRPGA